MLLMKLWNDDMIGARRHLFRLSTKLSLSSSGVMPMRPLPLNHLEGSHDHDS